MASYSRLPVHLPRGGQMCAYPRLNAHRGCPALRSRSCSVKINVQAKARSSTDFFDREREQSLLLAQLKRPPEGVLVVVGPRSSGKSRLLEEVLVGKKKHKALLAFVDGRDQKLTNGGIMAEALKEQGKQQLPEVRRMLDDLGKTAGKVADVVVKTNSLKSNAELERLALLLDAANKVFKEEAASSLNDVIKAYDSLLKLKSTRILNTSPLPVICIDEANVLMSWYKGGAAMEEDLNALLRFLVKMSKQTHQAHVILATSEYSFITWLTESATAELDGPFFETQVVGDFPEPEARLFLEHILGASVTDAEWAEIFEVCGGNAGLLRRASGHFRDLKDWTQALEEIWRIPMGEVESGLDEGLPWSEKQYCTILQLILEADHAAVIARNAYPRLKPGGKQAVQAMVKANLLAYRPASVWARDIPVVAFGPEQRDVVTAPSAAHLYCMRRLQRRGILKPPAEAAPSTPTAAQEPSPLEQQIKDVVAEISTGVTEMTDLRKNKPERWMDELVYLREKDKQLREKEKQLREKELLLLRKSDT